MKKICGYTGNANDTYTGMVKTSGYIDHCAISVYNSAMRRKTNETKRFDKKNWKVQALSLNDMAEIMTYIEEGMI